MADIKTLGYSRYLLPTLTKFRPEADKDRFERMIEFYSSAYAKEFQSILEDLRVLNRGSNNAN